MAIRYKGNDLTCRITVTRDGLPEDFNGKQLSVYIITFSSMNKKEIFRYKSDLIIEGNVLFAPFPGRFQRYPGWYSVLFYENEGLPNMVCVPARNAFYLVAPGDMSLAGSVYKEDSTSFRDGGIEIDSVLEPTEDISMAITTGDAQWGKLIGDIKEQTDLWALLQEKYVKPAAGIPASDIASGVIPDVSNFITNTVNNLTNYYLKSQLYTKFEIDLILGTIRQFHYEIYASLHEIVDPKPNVLYLIGPKGSGSDRYEEFVYVNYTWTKIGDTSVDLSNYVTINALNLALSSYTTTSDLVGLLNQKVDKEQNKGLSSNDFTDLDKSKLDSLENYDDSEIWLKIHEVEESIPTELSELSEDVNHRTVSDVEKETWNRKYDKPASGIPASDIASGVIPDVSNFITRNVNDLINYYLKSETYTRSEVQALVNAVKQFTYEVVSSLPTASAETMHKIYLVPSSNPGLQNIQDEYITIDYGTSPRPYGLPRYDWEQIGSTAIDLSNYVTTDFLNSALSLYTTTADLTTLLSAKQDVISDLQNIREGAQEGATAYQKPSSGIPASDIASGVIPDVSNFITNTVNNLTNYYLKSETYTRSEVQSIIASIQQFTYEVVNSLPLASSETMHKIYLVPSSNPETQNVKDEYITIDNGAFATTRYTWEQIGSTVVDLTDYVTDEDLSSILSSYTTTADLTTLLSYKANKVSSAVQGNFAGLNSEGDLIDSGKSANDFLPANTVIPDLVDYTDQEILDAIDLAFAGL